MDKSGSPKSMKSQHLTGASRKWPHLQHKSKDSSWASRLSSPLAEIQDPLDMDKNEEPEEIWDVPCASLHQLPQSVTSVTPRTMLPWGTSVWFCAVYNIQAITQVLQTARTRQQLGTETMTMWKTVQNCLGVIQKMFRQGRLAGYRFLTNLSK